MTIESFRATATPGCYLP